MRAVSSWVIAMLALCTADAWACTCWGGSLEKRFGAQNVFTAVVTGGSYDGSDKHDSVRATFDVTKIFKGSLPFSTLTSHPDGDVCGFPLEIGVEYLFFIPDDGSVSSCQGNLRTSDAAREVAALEAHAAGHPDGLAPIWQFSSSPYSCDVSVDLDDVDSRDGPLDDLALLSARSARLNVRYVKAPDSAAVRDIRDALTVTVAATRLLNPGMADLAGSPLQMTADGRSFLAAWNVDPPSTPGSSPNAYYALRGEDVVGFLSTLSDTAAITMVASPPSGVPFNFKARTANIGDTVEQFRACMQ